MTKKFSSNFFTNQLNALIVSLKEQKQGLENQIKSLEKLKTGFKTNRVGFSKIHQKENPVKTHKTNSQSIPKTNPTNVPASVSNIIVKNNEGQKIYNANLKDYKLNDTRGHYEIIKNYLLKLSIFKDYRIPDLESYSNYSAIWGNPEKIKQKTIYFTAIPK